jgi:hypothetical protein
LEATAAVGQKVEEEARHHLEETVRLELAAPARTEVRQVLEEELEAQVAGPHIADRMELVT